MTIKMTATEAKANILALLDDVSAGQEVEIAKHGRTVARLVPATRPHALKGSLIGVAMAAASEEDLFATGATWTSGEHSRPRCSPSGDRGAKWLIPRC